MSHSKLRTKLLRFIWGIIPWVFVVLIVIFIISVGSRIKDKQVLLAEAKKNAIKNEVPAVRVITQQVEPSLLKDQISLPAEIEPYEDLWVKAEAHGQVLKIYVKEGQTVKKGQIMVQLDERDYKSRLDRINVNTKLAKLEYERISALAKQKITSTSKLDETEARLNDLYAQRREASLALSRTKIRAPISGQLNEIKAKVGDVLDKNQPVARILQFDKVKVTVGVPESDVAAIFDMNEADIIIDALGKKRVKGKKVFLFRQPRTLARLFDLELVVPNPDGRILPGMFARVELVKETFDQALAIPLYAVITHGNDRYVYIEKEGKAVKKSVELGVLIGWQVHIETGLNPGEHVIIVGHRQLDDGQAVDVIRNVKDPSEILES